VAKLTTEQKTWIVMRLARYEANAAVRKAFQETFKVEITYQQVDNYYPLRSDYDGAKKWKALFDEQRARFLADVGSIGIANENYRLQMLHDMAEKAHARGNFALAGQLIEQAAKERGGLYTNRREVRQDTHVTYEDKTADELRSEIVEEMQRLGLDTAEVEGLGRMDDGSGRLN
jgi:hypothetical protein